MKIVKEEDREGFTNFMETVACVIYKESMNDINELRPIMSRYEIIENSREIGLAVGQVVLDKVIDLTKDMSREELVIYLAEAASIAMTAAMNKRPDYRERIAAMSKQL